VGTTPEKIPELEAAPARFLDQSEELRKTPMSATSVRRLQMAMAVSLGAQAISASTGTPGNLVNEEGVSRTSRRKSAIPRLLDVAGSSARLHLWPSGSIDKVRWNAEQANPC
jgi:hypothetical protein